MPSLLMVFQKRINDEVMMEINEMIIAYNTPDDPRPDGSGGDDTDTVPEGTQSSETIILEATCAHQNISYPQDDNLLNEAAENLEKTIDGIYRNRENLFYCRIHDIQLPDSSLGRLRKYTVIDRKTECADNVDRVEVERSFSLAKRCCGLGRIVKKLV